MITPISIPLIDWNSFLREGSRVKGQSISRFGDERGVDPKSMEAFLYALGVLSSSDNPDDDLTLQDHLFFTILISDISTSDIQNIIYASRLSPMRTYTNGLVLSGTLDKWARAVIRFCSANYSLELRRDFNTVHQFFVSLKLHKIWDTYSKKGLKDGTYILSRM